MPHHSEAAKAKISAAARRSWAAGVYDFLRKPKPKPTAEEWAARRALKAQRNRAGTLRLWAEGRGSTAGLFTPEARRKASEAYKTSPKAKAAREWAVKFRIAKTRARRVRSSAIFNELEVVDLVLRYQRSGGGDEALFARIIHASLPLIDASIRHYSPQSSAADFVELRHDLILKLAALLPKYDPRRGRAFAFFTLSMKNYLINNFHTTVRRRSRFQLFGDEELLEALGDRASDPGEKLESEEFLERLRALLRPSDWHWRWRWERKGRLPLPAWRAGWRWKRLGTMTA
jgi:hypothetical protein